MKKTALFFSFILVASLLFAQYDGNKLPSGLTLSTSVDDDDYTIIQINGETYVKAIRMDTLQSYMTEGMASSVIVLDTISGETGQFIISNGTGWLTPANALYEGNNAYSFGQRAGSVGNWSFITGFDNEASNYYSSVLGGRDNTASEYYSSVLGGAYNTASGGSAIVSGGTYNTASGGSAIVSGGSNNTASGTSSCVLSGAYNTVSAFYSGVLGGIYNAISGNYSTSIGGAFNTISSTYSSTLTSDKSSISGDNSNIIGGISDTITTDNNIILNSHSCEINTGEFNTINNSQGVTLSGGNNFVNNCTNSDFTTGQSFVSHSQYSQYKGADTITYVFASGVDTIDMGSSSLWFSLLNKGILSGSYVSYLSQTTWTDTIINSYLFNVGFIDDTLTRAEGLAAINSDEIGIKYNIDAMFTANSVGAYFANNQQSVFGTWNDSTPTTSDRLFQVGNGSGAGARADALCVYANGDADISGKLTAKTLASTDSAYLTKCVSQFHMIDSMAAYVIDTWNNITWDTVIANESTSCFSFNDDSTAFIYSGRAGIIRVQGCFHTLWDGSNGTTASIFGRARVNGVEARCTQAESTKEKNANDRGILPIIGTVYVEQGDTVDIQFRVTNLDYYLDGNDAVFDNAVGASINFEYMSQDN